jgi:hypothetical protein
MAHASNCPCCASRYEDIRGLLYSPGQTVGVQCCDDWHKGPGFDRSKLNLSDYDIMLLRALRIGVK